MKTKWQLLLALLWLWACDANAVAIRRAWLLEQIAELPPPTTPDAARHGITGSLATYPGVLSFQASGVLDFGGFELHLQGGRRFLPEPNAADVQGFRYDLSDVDFEIARYHALSKTAFGRLGIAGTKFFPSLRAGQRSMSDLQHKDSQQWIRISVATGLLPTEELPWDFRLNLGLFRRIDDDWMIVMARLEVLKRFLSGRLRAGGYFSFTTASYGSNAGEIVTSIPSAPVIEHYGFTLSPSLEWAFPAGTLQVAMPLRLYVDQDVAQSLAKTGPVTNPSEFLAPALNARLTVSF